MMNQPQDSMLHSQPLAQSNAIPMMAPTALSMGLQIGDDPVALRDLAYSQLYRTTQDLMSVIAERNNALEALRKAHQDTLLKLAAAAEFKDGDTGAHIVRIGCISELVARAYGLETEYAGLLRLAAPMHDIGKIGVPDHILKKPGALDAEEWKVMRDHPAIGARILGETKVPVLLLAAEVALSHHEKYDGSGYPNGLRGDQIPLSGAIVTLVDYFDALTMDRCYRKALPDMQVLGMIREQTGKHFDPAIAEVFMDMFPQIVEMRNSINEGNTSLKELADTVARP